VVVFVILCVVNAVIPRNLLAISQKQNVFPVSRDRRNRLMKLQRLFQRISLQVSAADGSDWHDHKFMRQKPLLSTILRKNIHQKLSHAIGLKKRAASGGRRGHE